MSKADELAKLAILHEAGVLTLEEYEREKSRLVGPGVRERVGNANWRGFVASVKSLAQYAGYIALNCLMLACMASCIVSLVPAFFIFITGSHRVSQELSIQSLLLWGGMSGCLYIAIAYLRGWFAPEQGNTKTDLLSR